MKNKKVLHLVEYLYLGGIERLLEQLAAHTGNKCYLQFFSYETETLAGIGKQIEDNGFSVFTYKKKSGRDWQLIKILARVIKENKIDVIHTHDFGPIEYAVILKILFPRIRLIHTQHTVIHFIKHRKYTLFFQFASFFYYRMITVSNFVRETILEHCSPMNRSSLIVIPNGVDTSVFKPGLIQNDKSRLNLVSIARISNEKNLNYIFNTCRLLKEAGIPFVFHHAGSSKKEELVVKIKEYINEHKLNDCVILHGFSIDAKAILDLGDIFLSASITEGHPVAVLEAMASEKICFCSDIAPHRELGPELIHLFDIVDEFSLFRLLKNYYLMPSFHDEDKRCKMASDIIVEKFSIDRMVDSYVKLYD